MLLLWTTTLLLFSAHETSAFKVEGSAECQELDLVFVNVLYRHGDRTPIKPYPNDPYKDPDLWPVEFGRLTSRGKKMQFALGQYLRERYDQLLGEKYSPQTIYVRSTNIDRTLMSAYSNLAGLYPPKGKDVWNEDLPWQPIPVHALALETDNILTNHAVCPKMEALIAEALASPKMKLINQEYQWMYDYLTDHTGMNVTTILDVDHIFDTLLIEEIYNMSLPQWTKKVYPDPMRRLRDLSFTVTTWTPELKRLRSGPLITELLKNMHSSINGSSTLKMHMFSGHDTTLSSLLNALGVYDPPIGPPYAACIMMELMRCETDEDYYVRFYYRNETDQPPHLLQLEGCPSTTCKLSTLADATEHLRPRDWEQECQLDVSTETLVTAVSAVVGLALALFVILTLICYCRRDRNVIKRSGFKRL